MLVALIEPVGGYPAGQLVDVPDFKAAAALVADGRARYPTLDDDRPAPVDIPADDDEPPGVTVAAVRAYAAAHGVTTHAAKQQLAAAARQAAPTTPQPKEA